MTGRENTHFIVRICDADLTDVGEFANDFSELYVYYDMPINTIKKTGKLC